MARFILENGPNIAVDVSNASAFHASVLCDLGVRWGFDVFFQYGGTRTRTSEERLRYDVTSIDERKILDVLTMEPQSVKEIKENGELNGEMCESNLYKLLARMNDRKLIERAHVEPPEGYKGRTLRGYRMSQIQYLDYQAFKKSEDERISLLLRKKDERRQHRYT